MGSTLWILFCACDVVVKVFVVCVVILVVFVFVCVDYLAELCPQAGVDSDSIYQAGLSSFHPLSYVVPGVRPVARRPRPVPPAPREIDRVDLILHEAARKLLLPSRVVAQGACLPTRAREMRLCSMVQMSLSWPGSHLFRTTKLLGQVHTGAMRNRKTLVHRFVWTTFSFRSNAFERFTA